MFDGRNTATNRINSQTDDIAIHERTTTLKSGLARSLGYLSACLLVVAGAYVSYFRVLPAVAIENQSNSDVQVVVALPESRLDFGVIVKGQTNTIYYSPEQSEGEYTYVISVDNTTLKGSCGSVRRNEYGKRFTITVTDSLQVHCSGQ